MTLKDGGMRTWCEKEKQIQKSCNVLLPENYEYHKLHNVALTHQRNKTPAWLWFRLTRRMILLLAKLSQKASRQPNLALMALSSASITKKTSRHSPCRLSAWIRSNSHFCCRMRVKHWCIYWCIGICVQVNGPIHHHQIPEGVPQRSWMLVTSVLICPAFFSQAPDFQKTKRRAFSTECPCIHLLSTRAANATFETQWNFFLRDSATKSSGNPQFQSAAHHQIYPLGTLAGLHWMIEREDCADSRLRMPAADG